MYWDKDLETTNRQDIKKIQLAKLQNTVKNVYENVDMYRERFDALGLKPEDIKTLEDLSKIPFTVKDDLRENYPFGLFAVPQKEVVRVHASSGTTGKPTVVGYTRNDLDMWSEIMARLVMATGVSDDDVAQVAFGYGLFTGAFGLHYALEKIGCTVVPTSSGNTEKQIMLMKDFGTTVLISTPSYALYLAETMYNMGIDPRKDLKLRVGLFGGEACSDAMAKKLEDALGILATQNYGLSEIIGPGVSGECACQCGLHINEDHFIAEIINPATGEVLPEGEEGELVLTAVSKEALPILRYRTKDITRLLVERCECGRTMARMAKVTGRTDDMMVIRGVNVFPSQIEMVLLSMEDVGPHYEIIVTREKWLDRLEIKVEITNHELLESYHRLEELQDKIRAKLRVILSIDAKVTLVEPQTLKRFEGKAKRVTDLRNISEV